MIDLLKLGFTPAGSCNCNGQHNRKFKRGEWLVYITSTSFKVKKNGSTVKGYADIKGIEKYLQAAIPQLLAGKQTQGNSSL